MKHLSLVSLVFLYLAVLVRPGLAQTESRNPTYRIGPRDLVEVRVFETQELNGSLRVSEDGDVTLPLVGNVRIAGLTEGEAAQRIKGILEEKVLQRASVSVQVQEYRSKPISVIGAVRQPGNLAFAGRWTLLEALTAAGGLSDAHGSVIHVLRRAENGLADQVSIRTDELLVRADPRVNIPIFPGDLINVPGEIEVTVFCLGEVERPGPVAFKSSQRISLLTAIALKRTDANGKTTEIPVDYKQILAGKAPDVELQPGDVIVIKESFF
jgi:polysaccharide export outer membrane protein